MIMALSSSRIASSELALRVEVVTDNGLGNLDKVGMVREEQDLRGTGHLGEHPEPRFGALVVEVHEQVIGEKRRSEEHTSELQSLMRISYAVFCLKKKKRKQELRIIQHEYNIAKHQQLT